MIGFYKVKGHSMEPYLKEGDRVITAKLKPRIGKIIVFEKNKRIYIKRVKKLGKIILAKGDNHSKSYNVKKNEILGSVIWKY